MVIVSALDALEAPEPAEVADDASLPAADAVTSADTMWAETAAWLLAARFTFVALVALRFLRTEFMTAVAQSGKTPGLT